MPDRQALATVIAAFQRCSKRLQEVETELQALLALCADQTQAHLQAHEQLPFAARFSPFSALLAADIPTPASRSARKQSARHVADTQHRTRLADSVTGSSKAASAAEISPNARPAVPGATTPQQADAPPRSAATDNVANYPRAAAIRRDATEFIAKTDATGSETAPLTAPPSPAQSGSNAGDLVEALLQRHAAPRRSSRLHELHAQSVSATRASTVQQLPTRNRLSDTARAAVASDAATNQAPLAGSVSAGTVADFDALPGRGHTGRTAQPDNSATRLFAAGGSAAAASVAGLSQTALAHGDDLLRTLLASRSLHSSANTRSRQDRRTASQEQALAPGFLQRAPSRLLDNAFAKLVTSQPAPLPTASLTTPHHDAAAPTADEVANGLERLLREQAWLRGVDLT